VIATSVRGHLVHFCAVAVPLLAHLCANAQTEMASQFSTEIGLGYESQTSALLRLTPEGELINIDGLQRLKGGHLRVGIQGHSHWQWGDGWGLSLSADVSHKRTPGASDFDFSLISVQPEVHWAILSGNIGWGLTLQRMEVAGRPFRNVAGTQLNWTRVDEQGSMWSMVADLGANRHLEFVDLNSTGVSLALQRHWAKPMRALESIDLTLYMSKEKNDHGFDELSYRNIMLSASTQWQLPNQTWSFGATVQKIHFGNNPFPDEVNRVDRSVGFEFSIEHELSSQSTLRLDFSRVRSTSSIAIYDNAYQQIGVKMRTNW